MPERGAGGKEPVSGSIKYSISRFEAGGVDVFAVFWRFIWWRRILVGVGWEGMSWFVGFQTMRLSVFIHQYLLTTL